LGRENQFIKAGTIQELMEIDFGEPLHCLIIPSLSIHPLELEVYLLRFHFRLFTYFGRCSRPYVYQENRWKKAIAREEITIISQSYLISPFLSFFFLIHQPIDSYHYLPFMSY